MGESRVEFEIIYLVVKVHEVHQWIRNDFVPGTVYAADA